MPHKNSTEKPDVRRLVERLVKREFGDRLMGIRFDGPFEDEDLDVDLLLSGGPSDEFDRWRRVRQELEKAGFLVLFDWDTWDELEEDEKRDWQSLWEPVNLKKQKAGLRRASRELRGKKKDKFGVR